MQSSANFIYHQMYKICFEERKIKRKRGREWPLLKNTLEVKGQVAADRLSKGQKIIRIFGNSYNGYFLPS